MKRITLHWNGYSVQLSIRKDCTLPTFALLYGLFFINTCFPTISARKFSTRNSFHQSSLNGVSMSGFIHRLFSRSLWWNRSLISEAIIRRMLLYGNFPWLYYRKAGFNVQTPNHIPSSSSIIGWYGVLGSVIFSLTGLVDSMSFKFSSFHFTWPLRTWIMVFLTGK